MSAAADLALGRRSEPTLDLIKPRGRSRCDVNQLSGYPAGNDIFYECGICGDSVPSKPRNAAACTCRNIIVDADSGRVSVKDKSKFRAYRETDGGQGLPGGGPEINAPIALLGEVVFGRSCLKLEVADERRNLQRFR